MASLKRRSMNPPLPQITEEEDAIEPLRRDIDQALGTDADRQPRNAFAEGGIRVHRHRLAGNAFYQEQYSQRKNTPPTMIHPAFRYNTDLYDISQALPMLAPDMVATKRPSLEMQEVSPRRAHKHRDTTMSPFINAGIKERSPSPPLKLLPSLKATHPTLRNMYDEQTTDSSQRGGSGNDDFVTVTRYSPKASRQDFGHQSKQFEASGGQKIPASPKKSLLDRFRASNRRGAVPLKPLPSIDTSDGAPKMPAKARAVLVDVPSSHSVARSPSKTKGFWSRRKPVVNEDARGHNPVSSLKAPPHAANGHFGRIELPGISHAHSLGYADGSVPPTPPSKDTPPEEKKKHEFVGPAVVPLQESTPTRRTGFLSLTDRLSPNKSGGYGKRSNPTLVTQASTHSLRATVVPNAMETQDFNDTKDRIDGLGLEGFNVPNENRQTGFAYSPSMYSPDLGAGFIDTFPHVAVHSHKKSKSSSDTGISDMGDISIIYPELARDPSISSFMTPNKVMVESYPVSTRNRSYSDTLRQERLPTVRRGDIDVVIHEVDDMLRGGEPSPSNSSLFTIPLGHASAQVSPLHFQPATFNRREYQQISSDLQPVMVNREGYQILPATTFNPWDVQQRSNDSPGREPRVMRVEASQSTTANKKNTTVMPGLRYDSGIDVDPQKLPVRQGKTSKHSRYSSPSRLSTSTKENYRVGTTSPTEVPHAAQPHSSNVMARGDNSVRNLIASYQQTDIGKRLSGIEESIKQDAKESRRRFEQEVLFDHRIASLEIKQFSREPSPSSCYESPVPLSRHSSYRKSLSPSHAVSDRKKTRNSLYSSPTPSTDDHRETKRISTGEAKDFYKNQLRDSPVMNPGNIDTPTGIHIVRSSSRSSDTLRVPAVDDTPHVTGPLQESEKIRQLQDKVDRQEEWIQATMARMKILEANYERSSDEN